MLELQTTFTSSSLDFMVFMFEVWNAWLFDPKKTCEPCSMTGWAAHSPASTASLRANMYLPLLNFHGFALLIFYIEAHSLLIFQQKYYHNRVIYFHSNKEYFVDFSSRRVLAYNILKRFISSSLSEIHSRHLNSMVY